MKWLVTFIYFYNKHFITNHQSIKFLMDNILLIGWAKLFSFVFMIQHRHFVWVQWNKSSCQILIKSYTLLLYSCALLSGIACEQARTNKYWKVLYIFIPINAFIEWNIYSVQLENDHKIWTNVLISVLI